nr:MAG TPA: hypothetical protein [Caudoviricetes sp.]
MQNQQLNSKLFRILVQNLMLVNLHNGFLKKLGIN